MLTITAFDPVGVRADNDEGAALIEQIRMERTVSYLAELSKRRRLSTIFPNQQSPFNGVQIAHTNTTTGNLTFLVRDLVRMDRLPAVFGRVYDSRISDNADFGPGWRLAVEETMVRDNNRLRYVDSSNSTYPLQIIGKRIRSEHPHLTGVTDGWVRGDRIQITHLGLTKTFRREQDRYRLISVEDQNGNALTLRYKNDRLTALITATGRRIIIERFASGRIKTATDDSARQVSFEYDEIGRLASATTLSAPPDSGRWSYEYDADNRLSKASDPRNETALAVTYHSNRVAAVVAQGDSYRFRYDGDSTWISNSPNKTARLASHDSGLTNFSQDYSGATTQIQLDANLHVESIIHEGSPVLAWKYDNRGNSIAAVRSSDTDDVPFRFVRENGQLVEVHVGKERIASYGYDTAGRVISAEDFKGQRRYGYDNNGALIGYSIDGSNYRLRYNRQGTVIGLSKDGAKLAYIELNESDRVSVLQVFTEDGVHRAEYENRPDGLRTHAEYDALNALVDFDYDDVGNLTTIEFENGSGKKWRDSYVTGPGNRVDQILGQTGPDVSFEYDAAGLPVRMSQKDREAKFIYDNVGRLVSTDVDGEKTFSIDYQPLSLGAVAAADERSMLTRIEQPVASLVFDSADNIAYNRLSGSPYGPIGFDSATARFVVDQMPFMIPDAAQLSSLKRRMFVTKDSEFDALPMAFDKPSNNLFIPPEFYSVNCFVCFGIVNDVTIRVGGSTEPTTVVVDEDVAFDVAVSGICSWILPGAPDIATFDHIFSFGDGNVASRSKLFIGNTTFHHRYSSSGTKNVLGYVECSCNSPFANDADSHLVEVEAPPPTAKFIDLALTFDDGPVEVIPGRTINVLNILASKEVSLGKPVNATFFVERERVDSTVGGNILAMMTNAGHEVAIHGVDPIHHRMHQETYDLLDKLLWMKNRIGVTSSNFAAHVRPPFGWGDWDPGDPQVNTQAQVVAAYAAAGLTRFVSAEATGGVNSWFGGAYSSTGTCEGCASHIEFVGYAKTAIDFATSTHTPKLVLLMHDIRSVDEAALPGIIDEIEAYAISKNVVVNYRTVSAL